MLLHQLNDPGHSLPLEGPHLVVQYLGRHIDAIEHVTHVMQHVGGDFRHTCPARGSDQFGLRLAQLVVDPGQLLRAGDLQGNRHQLDQQDGGNHRSDRGDHLDQCRQPVVRLPYGHDLHHMTGPAGQDKHAEGPEHPVEGDVFALADEVDQRKGNGDIAKSDEAIGQHIDPEQIRAP